MNIETLHSIFLKHQSVSTDTRNIKSNDIFFALKGANFNGNKYAEKALEKGASYVIVDEPEYDLNEKTILVDNVLHTLQELANFHRNYCKATVIGLTGSNGKTTTKELINAVLSKRYKTIATAGNLNNHIGVPLTLLSVKTDTEIAIVEMGANHQKEIQFLCGISEPDFGYITNFGKAHLEGFGGVEGVIKGKSELYEYLKTHNKHIFLNADDPIQKDKLSNYILKYGFSTNNTSFYTIKSSSVAPYISLTADNQSIQTKLIGAYNFTNCAVAVLIGKYFNVDFEDIKNAIESYQPQNNRSQIIQKDNYHIILDAYNANPTSMKAALENFESLQKNDKVLFLGDMFELGDSAEEEHQEIVNLLTHLGFEQVYLIGENFFKIDTTFTKLKTFDQLEKNWKRFQIPKNASILIKGSRGMALERILQLL